MLNKNRTVLAKNFQKTRKRASDTIKFEEVKSGCIYLYIKLRFYYFSGFFRFILDFKI